MRNAATILSVEHVTKRFRHTTALNDISFQVREGEIYGLLGPNGAGKTTLIKTVVGHLRPNTGTIEINHYDLKKQFSDAIDFVGAVVEYPMHYNYLSGKTNLRLAANMYPEVTSERISEVIELVGLQDHIDEKVKNYSIGMRQRLSLAQSILNYPQLLLLDEPMNGLDPTGMIELSKMLRTIAANGVSIVISGTFQGIMDQLCDRVGILSQGYLIAERDMQELRSSRDLSYQLTVDRPQEAAALIRSTFGSTAELLAESSQEGKRNVLNLRLHAITGGTVLRTLVNAGFYVEKMEEKRQTLEELYLQLTGGAEIE